MSDSSWERLGDFVLGIVSPTRAALRRHWRQVERNPEYRGAYEFAKNFTRGYKSAASGKNSTTWLSESNRSADGEILVDLPKLRARSRALNRDNAVASGINATFVRGVVGTGLRPQARTGEDSKDDALEGVWRKRADQLALGDGGLSHGAHQQLVHGKRGEDGEVFLRAAVAAPGEPVWIETIEAERVATPPGAKPADPKGRIVDGVEKDGFGRVVAYWILRQHPGDGVVGPIKLGAAAKPFPSFSLDSFDRVPKPSVRHDRARVTRPGQTRGVPRCHAILQELNDLDLLIHASLKRTQIAACLAVFLTSDANATDLLELTAETEGYQLDQKIEPGMIFRLYPGEKAEILNPNAGAPGLDVFVFLLARRIGAAVGLSPQAILQAWETLSYSAARTVKINDRQTFRAERADFASTLTWEWRTVLEDELLRGNEELLAAGVTIDDLELVEWIGDEEQWVDPQAEAAAVEIMLRLGLTTYQTECARLGRDWQENLRQKLAAEKTERDLREEMGLPTSGAQQTPSPQGGTLTDTEPEQGVLDAEASKPAEGLAA